MPTNIENLKTRRTNIYTELAAMASTTAGGKPTYNIDGQFVDHTNYRLGLYKELEAIQKMVNQLEGPFEVEIRGIT